jgi:hypothetical protein
MACPQEARYSAACTLGHAPCAVHASAATSPMQTASRMLKKRAILEDGGDATSRKATIAWRYKWMVVYTAYSVELAAFCALHRGAGALRRRVTDAAGFSCLVGNRARPEHTTQPTRPLDHNLCRKLCIIKMHAQGGKLGCCDPRAPILARHLRSGRDPQAAV